MSVNDNFSTLYKEYRKALAVHGRQPAYNLGDLLRIIGLFSDDTKYINKCIDCREDIGDPRQLCGHVVCHGVLFDINDNHFEDCDTLDSILDTFVSKIRLLHEYDFHDGIANELKTLR